MGNTHALKARIKSVESIQQITKSMKMVAASKLRRVQKSRAALELLADKSREILEALSGQWQGTENPFLEPREEKKQICFVLFVGNRGLCGIYNSSLVRYMELQLSEAEKPCFTVVCGSWGQDVIEPGDFRVRRRFADIADVPTAQQAQELTDYLKQLYLEGEADEIVLVYQKYCSILQQQPWKETLLPLQAPEGAQAQGDYIFEPDKKSVVSALVEQYINSTVYSVMLEARMGEHAARLSSMSSASDSTQELLGKLKQAMNHARQAAITTEISEIVSGAQALENDRH